MTDPKDSKSDPKVIQKIGEAADKVRENLDIPFELPWWTKAWNWFRKWGWVPIGFLLILLGFILGGALFRRRDGKVITPLTDIRNAVQRHDEEVKVEIEAARQAHVAKVIEIEREHQEQIGQLNEEQEQRRQELRRNPKKLARWLTGLARGDS